MSDEDGDEESGYDEVILPVDYVEAGPIVDDVRVIPGHCSDQVLQTHSLLQELHDILVKHLPSGCRLTALFDVR